MKTKEVTDEINDLPAKQRVEILTQILQGVNAKDPEIEKVWAKEARKRLDEFEECKVKVIPGEQFDKEVQELKNRFSI